MATTSTVTSQTAAEPQKNVAAVELEAKVLQFNADSVEFCPARGLERFFVCGNYQLNEELKQKLGRIYVFEVADNSGSPKLRECVGIDSLPAILDLKWSYRGLAELSASARSAALLGQASADGGLHLYTFSEPSAETKSQLSHVLQAFISDAPSSGSGVAAGAASALALSLDWNNRVVAASNPRIAVSQSNSAVSVFELADSGAQLRMLHQWTAHEYEVWISAFNCFQPNIVYSGADDCLFRGWDLRAPLHISRPGPLFSCKHDMGVCSIHSNPHVEHEIATGSYDEHVRVWDARAMKRPLLTHKLGGGVWRVKWHPDAKRPSLLLTACMHNGFHIVDVRSGLAGTDAKAAETSEQKTGDQPPPAKASARVVSSYFGHASLAYGCDWCHLPTEPNLIGSCSFYDRKLTIWHAKLDLL